MGAITAVSDYRRSISGTGDSTQNFNLEEGERWYVARTLSHREISAQFNLNRQGFRSYAPSIRRTVRHARKLTTVSAALFPSYIFVVLDLAHDRWRSVNGTFGVASLIMGTEQPRPVPCGVVEALFLARETAGIGGFPYDLRIGDKVRIVSGPFAQTLGQLDQLDDRGRVRVLLDIMGGSIPAYLDRSVLSPAT